ncbi:DUF2521 family protein [Aliibacillus thermotolerans]|nr:DUF2521 family protein [Aliibacillus thermotolerans]
MHEGGETMGTVISLEPHRLRKQWEEEKRLLTSVPVEELKANAEMMFAPLFNNFVFCDSFLEEACLEFALEAFIAGGKCSKYEQNGEIPFRFKLHTVVEVSLLASELYTYMTHFSKSFGATDEELKEAVEWYMTLWMEEGLQAGLQRKRLRL